MNPRPKYTEDGRCFRMVPDDEYHALKADNARLREALELAKATIERVYQPTGGFSSVQGTYDVINAALRDERVKS